MYLSFAGSRLVGRQEGQWVGYGNGRPNSAPQNAGKSDVKTKPTHMEKKRILKQKRNWVRTSAPFQCHDGTSRLVDLI